MCHQDSRPHLSEKEEIAAQDTLSIYCQPVEFYNIVQRRAKANPSFLQRCLRYKIQEKNKRRLQMSVSVTGILMNGFHYPNLLPICIMLARPAADFGAAETSEGYRFSRAVILTNSIGVEGIKQSQAKFTLPDMNKLEEEIKSGSLWILVVSFAPSRESISSIDLPKHCTDVSYLQSNMEGYCRFGRVPMEVLYLSWEKSPNLSLGERAEMMSTIDMHSSFVKLSCTHENKYISFEKPYNFEPVSVPQQVEIIISAEEFSAKDKSPYDSYTYKNIPSTSLSHITRLRNGNVEFNYLDYTNKMQRTEVTEDFCCPFCLVRCASFKGLKYHLPASHDVFNFNFKVTDDLQAVNVSLKSDVWQYKVIPEDVDPKKYTFFFCSKPLRRRNAIYELQISKDVHPPVMDSNIAPATNEVCNKATGIPKPMDHDIRSPPEPTGMPTDMAHSHSYADPECIQSKTGSNLGPPAMLRFEKNRKLSIERSHPRNRPLLQKRQFFHSQRAQPMTWEQVLSDCDSEDEVDDDVADLEDRRMLADFGDVTNAEKQMILMWNSFKRKQRVLVDGHIPWACEAFSKLHGPNLVQVPSLLWCWKLFMIKLWNHGLLDARGMNNCNLILEQFQKKDGDPAKS